MGKKNNLVFTEYYEPHLNGGTSNNPSNNQMTLTERMYRRVLTEMCANRFKWVGLPDTVDERFLELELFRTGLCVFFWDSQFSRYLAMRGSGAGHLNMYDNPTSFLVTAPAFSKWLNPGSRTDENGVQHKPECVPIWSNYLRVPDADIITIFSNRLARIDRTIDINIDNMRYTKVVTTDENQRQSWVNIIRQHSEGQPVIFGTQALDMSSVNAFDVGVHPDAVANLQIAKTKIWGECMTLLGINNANQDKKERLVEAEVGANDEQIGATKNVALKARRQAAEQINRLYDLDISVEFDTEQQHVPTYAMGALQ